MFFRKLNVDFFFFFVLFIWNRKHISFEHWTDSVTVTALFNWVSFVLHSSFLHVYIHVIHIDRKGRRPYTHIHRQVNFMYILHTVKPHSTHFHSKFIASRCWWLDFLTCLYALDGVFFIRVCIISILLFFSFFFFCSTYFIAIANKSPPKILVEK